MNVVSFTERFERGTEDEIWLAEVRDRKWLLFTRDDRWHYHRAELLAIIAAKARAFIFATQGSAKEIGDAILRALDRIADIADAAVPGPYIYKVTSSGVAIVFPSSRFRFPLPR